MPVTPSFQEILSSDAGANLLRSKSASVVIPFLYESFKVKIRQQIDSSELEDRLTDYLQKHINSEARLEEELEDEEIKESEILKNLDAKRRARQYIDLWCSQKKQYLNRIITNKGSALLLNPSIDRLFSWLEKCEGTETVGAESRFINILTQLRDLDRKTNQNAKERIKDLENQKKEIEREIRQIKDTGIVSTAYDSYQILERLSLITQSSKELLGDFNQMRVNFQAVINDIYNRENEKDSSRGDILGYTLDTNDELRRSPQGRSFTTFWNFISADSDNEINSLVDSIIEKASSQGLEWNDRFLFNLSRYFFESGKQIIDQNRVLTSRINKMLSLKNSGDISRVRELTNEIKDNIRLYNKTIKEKAVFPIPSDEPYRMEIETRPDISFPQARIPVLPEFDYSFGSIDAFNSSASISKETLEGLISQIHIDARQLENNLQTFYKQIGRPFSLGEYLEAHPVTQGLTEIVAFFTLKDRIKSTIDDTQSEEIKYAKREKSFIVKVPRIVFYV